MQARRASRELALILFSQFEKEITHYSHEDFENIIIKSVRILSDNASEDLKLTVGSLIDIKSFLEDCEAEHESNLSRPIGAKNKCKRTTSLRIVNRQFAKNGLYFVKF